jgi:glycerol-3-phosphate dehydrogenase
MPITECVVAVLQGRLGATDALRQLMGRGSRPEG